MSYQVIARKYRPQRFSDIVGQEHITKTLQNAVASGRLHHAYLFTGIRGIGKTTLARIFSKMLNCTAPDKAGAPEPCNQCQSCKDITSGSSIDVQEIDGASNTGVDDVREIRERVKFLPSVGKYKIYIIDEVHMLSTAAFNALLKTLEEPPAHVIFIFATTEAYKIPATILSRCQRYDFRRISPSKIIEMLASIAKAEGVEADNECMEIIANEADGSMRDAESLFDQSIAYAGKKLAFNHLKELLGFLDRQQLGFALKAIVERDSKKVISIADELFQSGENLNRFALELMEMFHNLLLFKTCGDIPSKTKILDTGIYKEIAPKVTVEECQQWFNIIIRGAEDLGRTKFPKTILDVVLINMVQVRPVHSIDKLLEKLDGLKSAPPSSQKAVIPSVPIEIKAAPKRDIPQNADSSWAAFFDWLKLNKPQVAAFMEPSLNCIIENSSLNIKFPHRTFASDRLVEPDQKAFLEKLASDFFKRPMRVNISFEKVESDAATQKKKSMEQISAKQKELKEEALSNNIIKEATNIFGAEIREIKTK